MSLGHPRTAPPQRPRIFAADELLQPTSREARAADTVSVIAYPLDYRANSALIAPLRCVIDGKSTFPKTTAALSVMASHRFLERQIESEEPGDSTMISGPRMQHRADELDRRSATAVFNAENVAAQDVLTDDRYVVAVSQHLGDGELAWPLLPRSATSTVLSDRDQPLSGDGCQLSRCATRTVVGPLV